MPMQNQFIPNQGGGFWEFLFGRPGGIQQVDKFNPQQQEALSMLLSQGLQGLQSGNVNLGPIEQQARQNFQSQTIPSIAERFTASGGNSRLGSGAFAGQLGAAGANLEQGLAGLRYDQLFRLLQGGLTPQFESAYMGRQPGFLENLGVSGAQAAGSLLPFAALGGFGSAGSMPAPGQTPRPQPNYQFSPEFYQSSNRVAGGFF